MKPRCSFVLSITRSMADKGYPVGRFAIRGATTLPDPDDPIIVHLTPILSDREWKRYLRNCRFHNGAKCYLTTRNVPISAVEVRVAEGQCGVFGLQPAVWLADGACTDAIFVEKAYLAMCGRFYPHLPSVGVIAKPTSATNPGPEPIEEPEYD